MYIPTSEASADTLLSVWSPEPSHTITLVTPLAQGVGVCMSKYRFEVLIRVLPFLFRQAFVC